jgi:hypothetical protein
MALAPPDTALPCRTCGRFTPHRTIHIPAFIEQHGRGPNPGRTDRACAVCGAMYLPRGDPDD